MYQGADHQRSSEKIIAVPIKIATILFPIVLLASDCVNDHPILRTILLEGYKGESLASASLEVSSGDNPPSSAGSGIYRNP
jgi:hypothetical protein